MTNNKENCEEISCFYSLDILFGGLETSSVLGSRFWRPEILQFEENFWYKPASGSGDYRTKKPDLDPDSIDIDPLQCFRYKYKLQHYFRIK